MRCANSWRRARRDWRGARFFTAPLFLTLALFVASGARWPRAVVLAVVLIDLGELCWGTPRQDLRALHAARFTPALGYPDYLALDAYATGEPPA